MVSSSFPGSSSAEGDGVRRPIPSAEVIKKLPPDGGPEFNRLVFEKSPYLLQHAANPVDWYSWGEAAFARAKKEDKPIFLSIGYSTCHWCHVMEHESFEDDEVAALMNEHFVCVKVDREERPDIDNIYMGVCQAMTGRGGWPMTIVMTPDKQPFFSGTYFPKSGRFGRKGMMELIPELGVLWKSEREKLLADADLVVSRLRAGQSQGARGELDAGTLDLGHEQLRRIFDADRGGFGGAPKFPTPHKVSFLLRFWARSESGSALRMAEETLVAMRRGGIYDHVGFGFHRYATDANWLVPHFEKMLYDQALLAIAYVEAFQATGKAEYAQSAREILTYVLRDMTSPEGGFYSAEDADSEGEEGKFYLWGADELAPILGDDEAKLFARVFNIKPAGNFRAAHSPPRTNIPHLTRSLGEHAKDLGLSEEVLRQRLEVSRRKLFEVREKRVHPYKDDKILTDWNGLMIVAFAKAAQALDAPEYARAAERAADFVLERLVDKKGRLLKRFRDGEAGLPAHVEDYAFFIWGLLELYETDFDVRYLQKAVAFNRDFVERFWDDQNGGMFFTADDTESPLVRMKEVYDGAIPSGNSVAMGNLLRLGRITGDTSLTEKAAAIGSAFSQQVSRGPSAYTQLLCALDFGVGPSFEVVLAGSLDDPSMTAMLRGLRHRFIPNKVVLFRPDGEAPPITQLASFTKNQKIRNGKSTAYVCRNHRCRLPTNDVEAIIADLLPNATSKAE